MSDTIRIGIIEDETLVLESLQGLFATNPNFQIVQTANTVERFLEEALSATGGPHVLLLDIGLPGGMSGLEGIRLLREKMPTTEIIMLTTFEESDKIFKALCAGATAYLTKRTPFTKIIEAVLTVHRGGSYMSPSIARKVVEHFAPKKSNHQTLTPRQQQIVEGIVEGLSYKMIADKLLLAVETVRDHIKHIYRKLEINSKGELIRMKLSGELDELRDEG